MSEAIIKKNGTDYPLLTMPNHYPADRVYLHGNINDDVESAVDHQEAMIATVQRNLTAVKAYAKGEQFVYNGLLYKTTATISSDGTITIGGNCELSPNVTEQIRGIVSSYSDSYRKCIKFADGTMIQTGLVSPSVTDCTAWGSIYQTNALSLGDFLEEFYAVPVATASMNNSSMGGWIGNLQPTKTTMGSTVVYRPTSATGAVTIGWTAIGRWKA